MNNCQDRHLPLSSLPRTSVIVCFHNEGWSALMRTIHSILDRCWYLVFARGGCHWWTGAIPGLHHSCWNRLWWSTMLRLLTPLIFRFPYNKNYLSEGKTMLRNICKVSFKPLLSQMAANIGQLRASWRSISRRTQRSLWSGLPRGLDS